MSFRGKSETKTIVGGLIWLLAIAALVIFLGPRKQVGSVANKLLSYFGNQTRTVELYSSNYQRVGVGDPLFLQAGDETIRVGNIAHIDFGPGYEEYKLGDSKTAQLTLFANAPKFVAGDYIEVHQAGRSMEWVLRTMMPPKTRQEITKLISQAWDTHQEDLADLFAPIIKDSVSDASRIVKEDLKEAIDSHRSEIDELMERYREQLVEEEILPLIRDEIWPIVQEEAQPLAETIGEEIWDEVSVWRFGWRYLYDKSPMPKKKLTEKEFTRFTEKSAIPILENHLEDFIDVQKNLLTKVSANEKVKKTFSSSAAVVINDPKFRDLVTSIFREVLVDNERLTEAFAQRWESPQGQAAIERANRRLDPVVTRIGSTLFGSTQTAITPEFARVLRNKVLHKDERWLTLHSAAIGNRDPARVETILHSRSETPVDNDSKRFRIPMFTSLETENYPIPAAPELEVLTRKKIAEKRNE